MSSINTNELNVFFAYIGKKITEPHFDKQFLWKSLEICKFIAYQKEKITQQSVCIDASFFNEALSISSLSNISANTTNELLKKFANELVEEFTNNPIIGSLPFQLQEGLLHFSKEFYNDHFGTSHLLKMTHYAMISFIAVGIYYSYSLFGTLGLITLFSFVLYWGLGKTFQYVVLQNEKKSILKTIQKEVYKAKQIQHTKQNGIQPTKSSIATAIEHWPEYPTLTLNLQSALNQMKQQLLLFSQLYPQKKTNTNMYMELDALKMSQEHIPKIISDVMYKKYDENTVMNVLQTMNKVIQSHLTELLWEDKRDIAVKQRYWLNKLSESNGLESFN